MQEVERGAVKFYAASHRPEDRAEELYHRLRLGDLKQAKARWMPEAAAHLAGAEEELPSRSAKRLLVRLMQGAPELELSEDEQLEWEQRTAEEVENLLTQGFTDDALAHFRRALAEHSP